MNFDKILEQTGEFGPWQRLIAIMLWITAIGDGIQVGMWSITGLAPSSFDCFPPEVNRTSYYRDFDESELFEESAQSTDCDLAYDYCSYYRPVFNQTGNFYYPNKSDVVKCSPDSPDYYYNSFDLTKSATTEFGLLGCGDTFNQLITSLVQAFFYIGLGIGASCMGIASDKFGRKKALIASILLSSGGSLAGAFMPEVWSYTATRLIAGIGAEGLFLVGFSMSMEIVGVKERVPCVPWVSYNSLLANCFSIPFAFGQMIPSFVSWITGDWRTVQWTISAASFLFFILWILPESPRWLIANGHTEEAKELVHKIAKKNKKKLSPDVFESEEEEEAAKEGSKEPLESLAMSGGISDMFAPPIRLYAIVLLITWPATTLGYFGMNMSMAFLTDDLSAQVGLIAAAVVEWPAYIVLVLLVDIWGRKPLLSYSLLISGVSCIICGFLCGTPKIILALLGKFCSSIAFNMVYMYTAEIFPTKIRNTAIGACGTTARIGAIAAPFVVFFLPKVTESWVQLTIMGVVSALGGLLSLLLPETLGFPLPDTFEDLEEIKKNPKSIWKCNVSNVEK